MPLILNIDTATEFASVCLAKDEEILMLVSNKEQKNHASFFLELSCIERLALIQMNQVRKLLQFIT